jgi:uncharacterized repeat protein (TIGR03803 family)
MRDKALAIVVVTLILAASAWASSESVLYSFGTQSGDGIYPYAGLISDSKGNLYGTAAEGGADTYYGDVFELSRSGNTWTETVLYSFTGKNGDGYYPYTGVVMDKSGNLYGATEYGGTYNYGCVYELKHSGSKWTESILHSFSNSGGDGAYPLSALVVDAKGNLYGTTYQGGKGYGTVYQLKPAKGGKWTETVIYSFTAGSDGAYPQFEPLLVGKNGYFYGETLYGGGSYNVGTVYELFEARGVWAEKVLHSFTGGSQGAYPYGGVTLDPAGNLYGTCYQGGASNYGIVFRLNKTKKWSEYVLYSFKGPAGDGAYLYGGVTRDTKGNFFGTTYEGGAHSVGTVFELTPVKNSYKETLLYSFGTNSGDGEYPRDAPLLDSKGNLYGTTLYGGKGYGTVFEVTP